MAALDEPQTSTDLRQLLLAYLDHYRDQIIACVSGMSAEEVAESRVPSGWTPAQLLNHLTFMEQRWFDWGFLGLDIDDPRGDRLGDMFRTPTAPVAELADSLRVRGLRTREIVEAHDLAEVSASTGLFADPLFGDRPPAHLQWTLLHVLQEYARHARHAGQLDIVKELGDAER